VSTRNRLIGSTSEIRENRDDHGRTMNDDEITRWIRWRRCKAILGMVTECLCIAFIPLVIIVWIAILCAHR